MPFRLISNDPIALWWRRVTVGFWLLAAGMFALMAWVAADSRHAAWNTAALTSQNLATALASDLSRTVESLDLSLRAAQRALLLPSFKTMDPDAKRQLMFDGSSEAHHLGSMFVMDRDGSNIYDSGSTTPRAGNVVDRVYFIAHRDDPAVGLYVSLPLLSRVTHRYSVVLSRRIEEDGQFAGVVTASIQYEYFSELFAKLKLGENGAVNLFKTDGALIFSSNPRGNEIGRDYSGSVLFAELKAGRSQPFQARSRFDGQEKLYAFSQVDGAPFVISVNAPIRAVYADWWSKTLISSLVALALFAAAFALLQVLRQQAGRRRAAEQQAAQSNSIFQAYFDNTADALFTVHVAAGGRLTYGRLNASCERRTGLREQECRGKTPAEVLTPALADWVEQHYRTCIETRAALHYNQQLALPGGLCDWHTSLAPVIDATGRVTMLIGSSRDMTDENRMATELGNARKMEAVGRLTAGVAHDFNNQLQTIISSFELLDAEYLDGTGDAQEICHMGLKAAQGGAGLTQRLLAFSRQQVLRPTQVDVATTLANVSRLAGNAVGAGIRIKVAVEPFTGDAVVDPEQLENCLVNLVLNARDAMAEGGRIVLHAYNASDMDARFGTIGTGDYLVIAVQDTGPGMDDTVIARAFEPFFTTKAFGSGAGLGLSMVQGVCQQSGGDARILRGGTGGTRVELWLPRIATDLQAATAQADSNRAQLGSATGRILLVDDDRDVARAFSAILVAAGFEVVAVASGVDGLYRLGDRDAYDLIVSDHVMSDMTGRDFLARAAAAKPGIPLMMVTGADPAVAGVPADVRLVQKPIGREALLDAVRRTIGANRALTAAA